MKNNDAGSRRRFLCSWPTRAGLSAIVAAAALLTAACGSGSSSPQVASVRGTSSGPSGGNATPTATATSPAAATGLLDKWAVCMRGNGDPSQADPTVEAGNQIHVIIPAGYHGTMYGATGNSDTGAGVICKAYLTAASTALRNGSPLPQSDGATKSQWAQCMNGHGLQSPWNLNSPAFQKFNALCSKQAGQPAMGQTPGEIEFYGPDGGLGSVVY